MSRVTRSQTSLIKNRNEEPKLSDEEPKTPKRKNRRIQQNMDMLRSKVNRPAFKSRSVNGTPKKIDKKDASGGHYVEQVQQWEPLITPNIEWISPELKPYIRSLYKFKMLKDMNLSLFTINLLKSDIGEMDQRDEHLAAMLHTPNGEIGADAEMDRKFYEHFGIQYDDTYPSSVMNKSITFH